jgi:hypothetical protein
MFPNVNEEEQTEVELIMRELKLCRLVKRTPVIALKMLVTLNERKKTR